MPAITCIMSAYNADKYIAEAIESILSQTYKDFEFIIADDGSSDNTPKIIEEYANKDERIIFLQNEEFKGESYTKNRTLAAAKGKYIAIMTAQDIAEPLRFERQAAYLDENEDIGALGSAYFVFKDNKNEGQAMARPEEDKALKVFCMHDSPFQDSTAMMRKSILDEHNLRYNEEFDGAADFEFWHRMKTMTNFHNLQEILIRRRFREKDEKRFKISLKIMNMALKEIINEDFYIPIFENPDDINEYALRESFRVISEVALMRLKEDCPYTRSELTTVALEQRAYILDNLGLV